MKFRTVALLLIFCGQCFVVSAPVAESQETEAATRQYAVAVGFQNQKLYDAAIDEWKTFLKKYPEDARGDVANHYLGTCCLQEKRYPEAIASFSTVISTFPNCKLLPQSMLNLGIAHYARAQKSGLQDDYAKAEASLGQMLAKFSSSEYAGRALFYRAECLLQTKQTQKAADAYQEFTAKNPDSEFAADALYSLGTAQEELKQTPLAAATFASFVDRFPTHKLLTEVQMRQAEILFNDNKFSESKPIFEQISRNHEFELADVAMLRHARCLYEEGHLADAGKLYWDVPREFKTTKHYDAAILAGSKCYFLDEKYQTARSGLEQLVKRDKPEAAEATQWLARTFLKTGDAKKALEISDQGLRKFQGKDYRPELELVHIDSMYEIPDQRDKAAQQYAEFSTKNAQHALAPQAQYMAALSSLETGNHANAKKHSQQFLKQYGKDALLPDVEFILAESQLLLGEHKEAVLQYRQFLKDAPQHANATQAQVRLGVALHMAGEYAETVRLLIPLVEQLQDKSQRSEAYSIIGRSEAAQEHFGAAVELLRKAITEKPDRKHNDETQLALAESLRSMGRNEDADMELQKLITGYPDSRLQSDVHFRLGESAYQNEKFKDAITYYTKVMSKWAQSEIAPHAQHGLSWSYFNLGEFAAASKAVEELRRVYPKSPVANKGLYLQAMSNYQLGEFNKTLQDVDALLKTNPEKPEALDAQYVKGLAEAGLEKFADAAKTYQGILTADKNYAAADKVAYELGWAFTELGNSQEAVNAFQRLATDWPSSPLAGEGLFRVGESFYAAEKYTEAADAYQKSAAQTEAGQIAEKSMHKLGWSHMKAKNVDAAATAFAAQLQKFPDGELAGDAEFLIGECYFQSSNWQDAAQAYQRVAGNGNSNYVALAMFRAGECAAALEDWRSSRTWHKKVLAGYPAFDMRPEARYGVGWALQNEGQYDKAIQQFERVTEETETETAAKARLMIGECCFAQKKHKEATRHFLKAALFYNHKEWSAMAYFEAARCFEVMQDKEQAVMCYEKLMTQFPQHSKVKDAERRLAELKKT